MGISSLGVGSSILTQDVLDQLRAADEAKFITPLTTKITTEESKQDDLELIDSYMKNLIDSINDINGSSLYEERSAEVTGTSVEVTAASGTDIQDFSLEVISLATKQIEQSGGFTSADATIAASGTSGTLDLNIEGVSIANISYDENTTLDELKDMINSQAGDEVNATVVQISDNDFRLFVSSVETGASKDISFTDNGTGLSANLTGMTAIQTGVDASLKFNGQAISRSSNSIDDIVTGVTIDLKEAGTSQVVISQDREALMEKFNSFVEKYNEAVSGIAKTTKTSQEAAGRGSFSSESTIKTMLSNIQNAVQSIGGGVGSMMDYGFDIDKEGVMTLNEDLLNSELDDNASNVQIFFAGGEYDNGDTTTTTVEGAFNEFATIVESYTEYQGTLDQLDDSISDTISTLEDRKDAANTRLDAMYEIMAKRFAAYDLMISKLSSASSMFADMANAQIAAQNN